VDIQPNQISHPTLAQPGIGLIVNFLGSFLSMGGFQPLKEKALGILGTIDYKVLDFRASFRKDAVIGFD